jgi:hypothetical protein
MRNYILRIYFGPTLFQRFSSSTTVKWGATKYRRAFGNRGRDGLSRPCPKTRVRSSRASTVPEPIAPYNSDLVILFNASLFIIFFLNFSGCLRPPPPRARAYGCAPGPPSPSGILLLTAISSFRRDCLASLASALFRSILVSPFKVRKINAYFSVSYASWHELFHKPNIGNSAAYMHHL